MKKLLSAIWAPCVVLILVLTVVGVILQLKANHQDMELRQARWLLGLAQETVEDYEKAIRVGVRLTKEQNHHYQNAKDVIKIEEKKIDTLLHEAANRIDPVTLWRNGIR